MNKLNVEIEIPVAQKTIEVFLPVHLSGYEAAELIKKLAVSLTNNIFMSDGETVLFKKDDGIILDLNMPIWMLNIKNGDKLVII